MAEGRPVDETIIDAEREVAGAASPAPAQLQDWSSSVANGTSSPSPMTSSPGHAQLTPSSRGKGALTPVTSGKKPRWQPSIRG